MGLRLEKSPYSLDDPRTTLHHRDVILSKPFLKKLYVEWYTYFKNATAEINSKIPDGKVLEIGSGGGFLQQVIPGIITSVILDLGTCDMIFSAEEIPLPDH
jgi:hypothetical protein